MGTFLFVSKSGGVLKIPLLFRTIEQNSKYRLLTVAEYKELATKIGSTALFPTKKHKWLLSMSRRLRKTPPPPGPVNTSATSAARRRARPENQLIAASTRSAADPAASTRSCAAYWPLDKMADIFFKTSELLF